MKIKIYVCCTALLLLLACNNKNAIKKAAPALTKNTIVNTDTIENEEAPRKESINLFTLESRDSSAVAFTSLSDIYSLSTQNDTLALPDIKKMGIKKSEYFTLEKKYRKRFLSKTNIAETDSVFVYDYAKNKLASFVVKNLNVSAMINAYMSEQDWPYDYYNYMIGFEINKSDLKGFSDYYNNILVYVGKENPFAQKQLKPIVWKKIDTKAYPKKAISTEVNAYLKNTTAGNTYSYETDSMQYFLQDYLAAQKNIYGRRLLVVDSKTNDIILEKMITESESSSPSLLNYENPSEPINQWTGKLFKNKPSVVFGFEYVSFGCPSISVIDKSNEEIILQCDNRH